MRVRSIRRQIRTLQICAVTSSVVAAIALLGAAQAVRQVTFDSITVHRINVMDREGKLAMVIAGHDDEATPVMLGYTGQRAQGNNADNGIIFFNQKGDEQGGLIWSASPDRSESADTLSFDTANTDQLLHVEDGDYQGHHYADIVGWDRAANEAELLAPLLHELDHAKTPAQRAAIRQRMRSLAKVSTRFFIGYDTNDVAQLVLADKLSKPRIKLFVTPAGQAKLQFLDASGRVTYELPK
ncbi:MAG TPA: hypothetical protein VMB20_03370 [Candidatus Acidoferrum sp.]|nr:hypothetical protein [Candidatus Acidoferrum sp.]